MSDVRFDEAAGAVPQRTISGGGRTLTTTARAQDPHGFTGRTPLLRTGLGVSFTVELDVTLGSEANSVANLVVELGPVRERPGQFWNYDPAAGHVFHYNESYGGVSASHGTRNGYPTLNSPRGRCVYHLHVKGNQLTFSAGPPGSEPALQPGEWTLPGAFFLYVGLCNPGCVVRIQAL
jgi:hypothetical protein